MRKYFSELSLSVWGILLLLVVFAGCSKDFDEVVDVTTTDYQVISVSSFNSFTYVVGDSTVTFFLNLNSSDNVSRVFVNIISSDENQINNNPVNLLDNGNPANGDQTAGDNRYTNIFPLSQRNPIGLYRVNYFVTDTRGSTKLAAVQQFTYDNGQTNIAPVISNAVIDPDTIVVNDTLLIQTSVQASDENGLNDIEIVYFIVTRPDGTSNNLKVPLFDDGSCCPIPPFNQVSGDVTADDGIFALKVQVDQNNLKGTYNFQFQARDRGGLVSNIIDYSVLIQ